MIRWQGIYEFVQVVDCGGFSAAAEQMGMSNSQVSKLVAKLEERLGVRLLNRTTRRFTLTDEGEHFYQQCKQTIDDFQRAELAISSTQNEPRGLLKVNIAGSFQERYVVPMLAEFLKRYPKLQVNVDFSDKPVDIVSLGVDLSIQPGELEDSSLVARKLGDNYYYLVAHPDYLKEHGTPETPQDLLKHNCLVGVERCWPLSNGNDSVQLNIDGNWQSNNSNALLAAARNSLGIARLPFFAVADDIDNGRLIEVLPGWHHYSEPVWIMYPHGRYLSAKVRLFIDYLIEQLNLVDEEGFSWVPD